MPTLLNKVFNDCFWAFIALEVEFKNIFIENPIYKFHKELEKLVNKDLVEIDLNQIKLTNKGLDFANLVWEEFV